MTTLVELLNAEYKGSPYGVIINVLDSHIILNKFGITFTREKYEPLIG